jgi:3-oxoacyl-[acyl-carrier protein] reductase
MGVLDGKVAPLIPEMITATPLGRFGQPQDMAPVAVFLASDAAQWVTGELNHVTGGL